MSNFPKARLGDHIDILSGFAFKSELFNTEKRGLPLIRIRDVVPGTSSTFYDGPFEGRYEITNGDILVGMDGEFNRARWNGGRALLNQRVCKIAPSNGKLNGGYLFYLLPQILKKIEDRTPFVTVKHLSAKDLLGEFIPLPPLAEQKRIAAILDAADTLRTKRRAAITKLDQLGQAIFVEMFTDHQANEAIGSDLTFVTSGGRGWAQYYSANGSRFIRSFDVQMNFIGSDDPVYVLPPKNAEAKRTQVEAGDVLLTITGSRIGRVSAVPNHMSGAYISQHVAILRPNANNILPEFLSFYLSMSSGGQRQIAKAQYGQTKPGLNFEQIRNFQVPRPPIKMQHDFCKRITAINQLLAAQSREIVKLGSLFASLQHRAFRGEL